MTYSDKTEVKNLIAIYLAVLDNEEEKDLFRELYMQYRDAMYRIAFGILHNSADAEDAVHEAFLCIANNFSKYKDIPCPKIGDLFVIIIRNAAIDIYRHNKRNSEYCETLEDNKAVVETDFFEHFEYTRLRKAIGELSEESQDAVYLSCIEGYSPKEIAKMLDISVAAAYKRIKRAKNALKRILEKEEG